MLAPPALAPLLLFAVPLAQPPGDLPAEPAAGDLGLYADPADGPAAGEGLPSVGEQIRASRARDAAAFDDDPAATAPVEVAGKVGGAFRAGFPVTFTLTGPETLSETGTPNPFTQYRLTGAFRVSGAWDADESEVTIYDDGTQSFSMPLYSAEELNAPRLVRRRLWDDLMNSGGSQVAGYFAADGDAADTGATAGNKWRLHLTPPAAAERVRYRLELREYAPGKMPDHLEQRGLETGELVAAAVGEFAVEPAADASKERPRDLRAAGPLISAGGRLWLAGAGRPFFKTGANSPENLLAYADFDGTRALKGEARPGENVGAGLHRYEPHLKDWNDGDPTWGGGRGKALIGGLNYLASAGVNSIYFVTFNVAGDGKDVWPHVTPPEGEPEDRTRFDCSKLDQWERVFAHASSLGLALHVVLTETENESLFEHRDGGVRVYQPSEFAADDAPAFADTRKLYYRELIGRFGHHPGVMWNLAEEIGFSDKPNEKVGDGRGVTAEQIVAFADYLKSADPYERPVTIHTFPNRESEIYTPLLGDPNIDGASLQMPPKKVRDQTLAWLARSEAAGAPWFACYDEQNPADTGVMPDGADGVAENHRRVRRAVWANLFSGGSGCEFYFGYKQPHNDLTLEDFRSRAEAWRWAGVAREFAEKVGLARFEPALHLTDEPGVLVMTATAHPSDPDRAGFYPRGRLPEWADGGRDGAFAVPYDDLTGAAPGEGGHGRVLVYLPAGTDPGLRVPVPPAARQFQLPVPGRAVRWFDPLAGGEWQAGSVTEVPSGTAVDLGAPPGGDRGRDWVVLIGG